MRLHAIKSSVSVTDRKRSSRDAIGTIISKAIRGRKDFSEESTQFTAGDKVSTVICTLLRNIGANSRLKPCMKARGSSSGFRGVKNFTFHGQMANEAEIAVIRAMFTIL